MIEINLQTITTRQRLKYFSHVGLPQIVKGDDYEKTITLGMKEKKRWREVVLGGSGWTTSRNNWVIFVLHQ